ncbi:MFS transporter [Acinetobacter sp. B5B]|uniref:MFS transporter n=1 Tax=Acinetobacter baretiae TaxID=2605383 RepID=UPI0018C218C0|nr:MFS transporter [Acinetobacter baretiae]MBF7683999.1 MFS transporter [Acinetobacter baretiae]
MKNITFTSATYLFLGTLFAAIGYGATFLFTDYIKIHGGDEIQAGLVLASAMIGTFAGVPIVGWFSGRIDAAKLISFACIAIALGFLILSIKNDHVFLFSKFAGFFIGLGWGMFYVGAPMSLSERVSDENRSFWFTRFGAVQMAGIGLGPVIINAAVKSYGISIENTFAVVFVISLVASIFLYSFAQKEPIISKNKNIRTWIRHFPVIAKSFAIFPIIMVGLGASVFSGLMIFQTSLVEGTAANPSMFFIVYTIATVLSRVVLAPFLRRFQEFKLMMALLFIMSLGVFAMFGVNFYAQYQIIAAALVGVGYGLVYPLIQTWVVNSSLPEYRQAALTWFVMIYFIGIFGFPVLGGFLLVHFGKLTLVYCLLTLALIELAIVIFASMYKKLKV